MATDIRHALEFTHDICGHPLQAAFKAAFTSWLKNDPQAAALIAHAVENPEGFSYHGFIGDLTEAYGQALASGEHPFISDLLSAGSPR